MWVLYFYPSGFIPQSLAPTLQGSDVPGWWWTAGLLPLRLYRPLDPYLEASGSLDLHTSLDIQISLDLKDFYTSGSLDLYVWVSNCSRSKLRGFISLDLKGSRSPRPPEMSRSQDLWTSRPLDPFATQYIYIDL